MKLRQYGGNETPVANGCSVNKGGTDRVKQFNLGWDFFWPPGNVSGKNSLFPLAASLVLLGFFLAPSAASGFPSGKVTDLFSGKPVEGAVVTLGKTIQTTDPQGQFFKSDGENKVMVRAHGYLRAEQNFVPRQEIKLVPFSPKALYLSFYGIGDRGLRNAALGLIRDTELNALVIDVKGDKGLIPFPISNPLAQEVGAQRLIITKDMKGLIQSLKEKGIYTIARIVTFKDPLLAAKRPDWAVKNSSGEIWYDREKLTWVDPFIKEVWEYNIQVAITAAQCGFDEIQFDYVRFPDSMRVRFSQPNTAENRVRAITGFLMEARNRLAPYNVFLAADIFGYVHWNYNDTDIGQKLENLSPHLDYLSPMLYPSGFQFGIPGYRNPVAHPHEIVYLTLKKAQERTQLPSVRFRPWLQAFRDYAFDRRHFTAKEIKEQITAVEKFGSNGFMLWNPRNVYNGEGLKKRDTQWTKSLSREGS
jgi:hypothetical protein